MKAGYMVTEANRWVDMVKGSHDNFLVIISIFLNRTQHCRLTLRIGGKSWTFEVIHVGEWMDCRNTVWKLITEASIYICLDFFPSNIAGIGGINVLLMSGKYIKSRWAGKMTGGVNRVRSWKLRIWGACSYWSWQDGGSGQRRWSSEHYSQRLIKGQDQVSVAHEHAAWNHKEFYSTPLTLW